MTSTSFAGLPNELQNRITELMRTAQSPMCQPAGDRQWAYLYGAVYSIGFDIERLASHSPHAHWAAELRALFKQFAEQADRCDALCSQEKVLKAEAKVRDLLEAENAVQGWRKAGGALCQWLEDSAATPRSLPADSGPSKEPPPKQPSELAIECYRIHILRGISQTGIAAMLTQQHGQRIHQATVSRHIKAVVAFLERGGVLPPLNAYKAGARSTKIITTDPAKLDYLDKPDGRFWPRTSPLQRGTD